MLFNYIKLSLRLLARKPFFTFINVAGLSVGFAVFFVLWQHSTFELKSDQFHRDHERIYKIYVDFHFAEGNAWQHYIFSTIPPVLATVVKEKRSDIEMLTRLIHQKNFEAIRWAGSPTDTSAYSEFPIEITLTHVDQREEKRSFKETRTAFADPNFFEFFSVPLKLGQPNSVLNRADAIVLSSSTAKKYFGNEDPLGKIIALNDEVSFTVTGVFKDLGNNTHLNADVLFSTLHISNAMHSTNPFQETAVTYFKLKPGADVDEITKTILAVHLSLWDFQDSFPGSTAEFHLQPLKDTAFEIFENDSYTPKSRLKLQVFLVVGILVLVMAWINYLNLQLSTQASRMKELAARKTAGARINDFIVQFLIESLIINLLAVGIAVTIIQLVRMPLEILFQLYVPAWEELRMETVLVFLGAMCVGVLVAAMHPAIVTLKLPIRSMLTFGKVSTGGTSFTRITSVVQFAASITLMIWVGSVFSQVNFVLNNSWGLDREKVIVLELPVSDTVIGRNHKVEELKTELLAASGITDVTISSTVAGDLVRNRVAFWRADDHKAYSVPKSDGGVDERFIPFYNLNLIAGRNFLKDHPADRNSVILSRVAALGAGWTPNDAIGKKVVVEKYSWRPQGTEAVVIGVMDDHRNSPLYLQSSLLGTNRGIILTYGNYIRPKNTPEKLSIRIESENAIEGVKTKFESIFPGKLFHWYFLDNHMNAHYHSERIARNQITLFTSIAIGIACLGLLGVISNKVISKTKEIGIRKVLGARLHQIGQILLSATFKQVLIAITIALPLAYLLSESYMEKFSERIALQWWHFVVPVLSLMMIMLMSVAAVVWKAAIRNPVEALKHE